jgi:hypothetical protein
LIKVTFYDQADAQLKEIRKKILQFEMMSKSNNFQEKLSLNPELSIYNVNLFGVLEQLNYFSLKNDVVPEFLKSANFSLASPQNNDILNFK